MKLGGGLTFKIICILIWLVAAPRFAGAVDYYFPIIALGFTPGSTDQFYVTELVINNPSGSRINGVLSFYAPDGSPMDVTLRVAEGTPPGTAETDSFFEISVPGNGAWRAYTSETAELKTGWVTLDMDDFVTPVAMFSLNSRRDGLTSEATVFESSPGKRHRLFADTSRRSSFITQLTDPAVSDTGVAIANTGVSPAAITVRLLDTAGRTTQSIRLTLQPFAQTAKFLRELFPGLSTFQGTVELQSDVPIVCLGLRFTGPVFTTIPVAVVE